MASNVILTSILEFTYQCQALGDYGYCGSGNTYKQVYQSGSWDWGYKPSSSDLKRACSNDHPKCKAYEYSSRKGYGHLCTTNVNAAPDGYDGGNGNEYKICVKIYRNSIC